MSAFGDTHHVLNAKGEIEELVFSHQYQNAHLHIPAGYMVVGIRHELGRTIVKVRRVQNRKGPDHPAEPLSLAC